MKALVLMTLLLAVSSCSNIGHLKTDDSRKNYAPTKAIAVKLFSKKDSLRKYEVLGIVVASTDSSPSSEWTIKLLKEEAAKIGADRIMNTQIQTAYGFWTPAIEASAVAVKMKGKK